MNRLAYVIAVGLTLAGIVHIGSLLGVPWLASRGAYDRLAAVDADGRFAVLPDEGDRADLLPFHDPAFVIAGCRYDVSTAPVTVRAVLPSSYGAMAVHDRYGQPFYALTDRAATAETVEVTILGTADAAAAAAEEPAEGGPPSLKIVSPTPQGFVLVRLFADGPSARKALRETAAKSTCAPATSRTLTP